MVYRVVDQQQRKSKAEKEREGGERQDNWSVDLHDSCQLLSTYYSVAIAESQGRRRVRMRE